MITTGARAFLFAAVICSGMLAACDDSPEQAEGPATAAKPAGAAKIAGLEPDMVAAVSAAKTATMLGVHFALRAVPTVNQPLPIDIAIVPHRDFTSLRAHFESRDGLPMTSGDTFAQKADAPKEKVLTHELMLQPAKDGLFMITAIVETEGADGTVTRVFSIPVVVSPPEPASAPTSAATPAPAAADSAPATN
ncbi:MAG: hypothetical protein WDO72_02745 [Pseudomonadota bacterium]